MSSRPEQLSRVEIEAHRKDMAENAMNQDRK
jgi:hypothetical protein